MISVCVGVTRAATTRYLINSILRQTYQDWELLVVLQSADPLLRTICEDAQRQSSRVRIADTSKRGRSAALNCGVAEARGEIIAFTDDDCEASPQWLDVLADCFTRQPRVGLVAGDCLPSEIRGIHISVCPATRTIECIYDPAQNGFKGPPGFYWGGGNVAMRREVFDLVGNFDESLGPGTEFPAAEDVDFGLRAESVGIVMWTTPRALVYHSHGRRTGLSTIARHLRTYARGQGALAAKLKMWDHRLWYEWGPAPATPTRLARDYTTALLHGRIREIINIYQRPYIIKGMDDYIARYELGPRHVARLRPPLNMEVLTGRAS